MTFFDNHQRLFATAFWLFVVLTIFVAILPALRNQNNNHILPGAVPLSDAAVKGKALFVANGCVACHTQQVRNVAMDKVWGERPGIPADYAAIRRTDMWRNTATLMGTERTGPDLTSIGTRQPSRDWHLVHLYNPRIVVPASIMPAYPWLFVVKEQPDSTDIVVNVPVKYRKGDGKVVAAPDALYLIAYLQSLQQVKLPGSTTVPEFLYKQPEKEMPGNKAAGADGKALYTASCQSCHQANGEGLAGAFPSLKGSTVVKGDDLELYVRIIMYGYDARPEYGVMPSVGLNAGFTEKEVAALINFERSSWGNTGKAVTPEEIKKLIDFVKLTTPQP